MCECSNGWKCESYLEVLWPTSQHAPSAFQQVCWGWWEGDRWCQAECYHNLQTPPQARWAPARCTQTARGRGQRRHREEPEPCSSSAPSPSSEETSPRSRSSACPASSTSGLREEISNGRSQLLNAYKTGVFFKFQFRNTMFENIWWGIRFYTEPCPRRTNWRPVKGSRFDLLWECTMRV